MPTIAPRDQKCFELLPRALQFWIGPVPTDGEIGEFLSRLKIAYDGYLLSENHKLDDSAIQAVSDKCETNEFYRLNPERRALLLAALIIGKQSRCIQETVERLDSISTRTAAIIQTMD